MTYSLWRPLDHSEQRCSKDDVTENFRMGELVALTLGNAALSKRCVLNGRSFD